MFIWTTAALGILVVLLFLYLKSKHERRKYPPGPRSLPFIGHQHLLTPTRYIAYHDIGKQFGDVFTIENFLQRVVVLNSIKAIREALVEKGNIFSARPTLKGVSSVKKGKGVIMSNGQFWQEHRRFALKTLRDLGFAKSVTVEAIHAELDDVLEYIQKSTDVPLSTKLPFAKMTTNVICRMVLGQRLSEGDDPSEYLLKNMIFLIQTSTSLRHNLMNVFPNLSYIPFFATIYNAINTRTRSMFIITNFIRKIIREHYKNISDVSEPRDFTDALILHRMDFEKQNADHSFDEESMVMDIFDLFLAGTDTTSVTLSWGMLMMAIHPDIQARTRSEIHEVLGTESYPTMQQRAKLNYTLAVIDEVSRVSTIVPMSVPHMSTEETVICGQSIPKNATIVPNIYSVHNDDKLWKDPHSFNPKNFLDEEGNYKPSDNLIQFSLGRRSCLGESLARMEVFVFFVGIMQKHRVTLADRVNINLEKLVMGIDSAVRHLEDHDIIFHSK